MSLKKLLLFAAVFGLITSCTNKVPEKKSMPLLKISENNCFIETEDGDPFFWLGDTGWLLFTKLTREDAEKYLNDRVEKGFNVIQIMVLHTLSAKNVYGDSALINKTVSNPLITEGSAFEDSVAYDYWDHVDYIVDMAANKGLYMALVPVWGSNVKNGGVTVAEGAAYGKWLANRYKNRQNIIWLNGGDIKGEDSIRVWKAIGENINRADTSHLITFHPRGRTTSSIWFQNESWLDFNMFQSGHRRYDQDDTEWCFGEDNYKYVQHDLELNPLKPTIDGEPSYEGIPQGLHDTLQPYWKDCDVRRYGYWSVFSGAFGYTYGHSSVMQFYKDGDGEPAYGAKRFWSIAKDDAGASQMMYLKKLMLSRPFFDRVPDQTIIAGDNGEKYDYQVATRGHNYAFVYTYNGRNMEIQGGKIEGNKIKASWFNPRDGQITMIGDFENSGVLSFDPPGEIENGNDWVLILDTI
ncbi:MAG: glycoside hydrolase family 140 protein [Marinilabiliaceae bacterium]|nr:glycoside hydrolase family 140 protein [Marinilabiliaceae bacterium]